MFSAQAGDAVNMLRDREVVGKCDTKNLLQEKCSLCKQCRINHVADVANATGLRPQGGLRKSRKFVFC